MLLLDEPLGALDAKLRKRLQIELKALQEEVGITFIYVTHDQEEALTMSDRIAVMSQGRVEQVGRAEGDLRGAATAYVADFLGVSNLMDGHGAGARAPGGCRVKLGEFELIAGEGRVRHARRVEDHDPARARRPAGARARPARTASPAWWSASSTSARSCRSSCTWRPARRIQAWIQNEGGAVPFESGTPVTVHFPREALRVLPDTGTPVLANAELDDSRGRRLTVRALDRSLDQSWTKLPTSARPLSRA